MNCRVTALWLICAAQLGLSLSAAAHGLAGNRFFPGTLAIDDPAVGDDLSFPFLTVSPTEIGGADKNTYGFAFSRLLTSNVSLGIDSGLIQRSLANARTRSGFDTTNLTLKARIFEDDPHEMLVSTSLVWGIGGSGSHNVAAGAPDTLQPGIFIGKGLGDLPDQFAALRPFAITSGFAAQFPLQGSAAFDNTAGADPAQTKFGTVLHWGFSLQYSTYYLTDRFTGRPPAAEPLDQLVPLVEFAVDSPLVRSPAQKTSFTANPGLAYVGQTWQVAAEAIVPMDRGAGHGLGARVQLLLFLDDLIPALFDRPLLSR